MSYATMDHAGWVADNNRALNRINAKRRGWQAKPETLTDFQARAMDILGITFGGIYNAPINWNTVDYLYGRGVQVSLRGQRDMATFDQNALTTFVLLCHAGRVRGSIGGHGMNGIRLSLYPRVAAGGIAERHPDMAEAMKAFDAYVAPEHRIRYRAHGEG